jgi:hypothetical protein
MEETRNKYGVCMGKALGNRLPERLKRRTLRWTLSRSGVKMEDGCIYLKVVDQQ